MTTELTTTTQAAIVPVNYPVGSNPALAYLESLSSEESRRTMRAALNKIAELSGIPAIYDDKGQVVTYAFVPWHQLRYQHTQAIRARLAEQLSPATANKILSALRGVLKKAYRLGLFVPTQAERMQAEANNQPVPAGSDLYARAVDIDAVKGGSTVTQAEKGRHLASGELAALINACDDGTAAGARDAALVAIAYTAGLRRAELAGLRMEDWNADKCTLTIAHGKGNKRRAVPIAGGACDALDAWLDVRGPWAGPIFTRILRGDHVTIDGLTGQAIYYILSERAAQAGVSAFSPHDMRRTFAGDLLDAGADISTVQKLMGHANVSTTQGYDRRDERAKRAAVNKLHIPFRRRK